MKILISQKWFMSKQFDVFFHWNLILFILINTYGLVDNTYFVQSA